MMAVLMPWWRDRTLRERWLLAIMAVLLAGLLLWLGALRPLAAAREAAQARGQRALASLAQVERQAQSIRTAAGRPASTMPLAEQVSARLSAAGLAAEQLSASGDGRVSVRLAAVRAPVLLGWLAALQAGDGLIVERLDARRNSDGSVMADISLRRAA